MNRNITCEGVALHVKDVERSIEFYTKLPGARLLVHREAEFALIQFGASRVQLIAYGDDKEFRDLRFHLEMETSNLYTAYDDIESLGIATLGPPAERPWGEVDFRILDPDGNMIELSEANPILAKIKRRLALQEID